MLESALFWLAVVTLLIWVVSTLEAGIGMRRIRLLEEIPPLDARQAPSVTVVVAARNEEQKIASALRSVLRQDYPRIEVLVVNDRSNDQTGAILDEMTRSAGRLRVSHITELPAGWLGKNHALEHGARAAAGEWILFTDADVKMEPSVISRAMGYTLREGLDHLTIAPRLMMPGAVLSTFTAVFAFFFARFAKPWKARDPRSRRHVGIGAFNLVRASSYWKVGGHRPLAMRPDDDMKLAKLLKMSGCTQEMVTGGEMVSVEWYGSLREAVGGLEKNAFAGLNYSVPAVIGACLASLAIDVWPFAAILLTGGSTRWLNVLSAGIAAVSCAASTRASGAHPAYGLAYPLATLLLLYVIVRSAVLALHRRGIRWRDTLYPLDQLRANRV
ncbi:MAG: glycosyltransferase [Gemmatimonadetes bacterium]|nr:glycosyltransferase [Gemmatimonadota bacterium]